jgi:hypothetical protein
MDIFCHNRQRRPVSYMFIPWTSYREHVKLKMLHLLGDATPCSYVWYAEELLEFFGQA